MKKKSKKLTLSVETMSKLSSTQLRQVGGASYDAKQCPTGTLSIIFIACPANAY